MKQGTLFRYPAVAVIWRDCHARNQAVEYTEDEIKSQFHRGERVITLGLLLHEDADGISLYTEETGPDAIRGANFILKVNIEEIVRLGFLKTPRKPKTGTPEPIVGTDQ